MLKSNSNVYSRFFSSSSSNLPLPSLTTLSGRRFCCPCESVRPAASTYDCWVSWRKRLAMPWLCLRTFSDRRACKRPRESIVFTEPSAPRHHHNRSLLNFLESARRRRPSDLTLGPYEWLIGALTGTGRKEEVRPDGCRWAKKSEWAGHSAKDLPLELAAWARAVKIASLINAFFLRFIINV